MVRLVSRNEIRGQTRTFAERGHLRNHLGVVWLLRYIADHCGVRLALSRLVLVNLLVTASVSVSYRQQKLLNRLPEAVPVHRLGWAINSRRVGESHHVFHKTQS